MLGARKSPKMTKSFLSMTNQLSSRLSGIQKAWIWLKIYLSKSKKNLKQQLYHHFTNLNNIFLFLIVISKWGGLARRPDKSFIRRSKTVVISINYYFKFTLKISMERDSIRIKIPFYLSFFFSEIKHLIALQDMENIS